MARLTELEYLSRLGEFTERPAATEEHGSVHCCEYAEDFVQIRFR